MRNVVNKTLHSYWLFVLKTIFYFYFIQILLVLEWDKILFKQINLLWKKIETINGLFMMNYKYILFISKPQSFIWKKMSGYNIKCNTFTLHVNRWQLSNCEVDDMKFQRRLFRRKWNKKKKRSFRHLNYNIPQNK